MTLRLDPRWVGKTFGLLAICIVMVFVMLMLSVMGAQAAPAPQSGPSLPGYSVVIPEVAAPNLLPIDPTPDNINTINGEVVHAHAADDGSDDWQPHQSWHHQTDNDREHKDDDRHDGSRDDWHGGPAHQD